MNNNWTYKKLGEVCEILNGFAFKSDEYKDNGIRVMRITNVQKGEIVDNDPKFFPLKRKDEITKYILREGDVLMSLTGNVGRVGILEERFLPAALNQRVACLRLIDNEIDKRYLFHILNSDTFENDCIFNAAGIAQKNMSTRWLEQYEIPVPPIETQSRIVSELDLLQSIIDKQQAQLKELDTLAQAVFYDMFGDPVENEKGWEVKKLGEECSDMKYGTSRPACENGQYPYLRMCNISYDGYLDLNNLKTIDIPKDEIDKCLVKYGDILFNRTNSIELIGKTCMFDLETPMIIAGYIIRVRLSNKLEPRFISRMFNLPSIKKLLREMAKGAVNQANINSKELASIDIPVPPLSLQQSFAAKIESIEKQKAAISKSIAETEKLFEYTMDKYFG